ncbi:hypothetical protein COCSUDRAFT_63942 [Coccomyxa subellipsoidea C-169]|uniref:Uncharacterized protein n=1 Tax=Coccomyxa subellipsoidea (strain C-169) TaxID=574566 RepID=I0YTS7_COCSC|nr:hypothetical protein COCSUDRAFT_58050 [Coccomyxa subellipsoidea C-169]XP_005646340.1 hypothetical protein COCSUDRAFT_56241 [Coccomyxa subellipsoidea C-169]XP_005647356.1 hypothetical protein COCSUDRAFT_63942 [Coccomyxa subellipsoidea C-169]EIE20342.1 hypothetical protein COCSUDRAFT_58050 [Coccomyxa subellipsoidea C-169]EIE21796.1 hypothetical protein COCSUDRAFT_56241 [Coccomyxa subellipsoidea C-169]EIE22812.1 hypothetical protein COCSUDRAFT_63942 [Coccomyxa subellipsoidea C-169]|eukprot:XP_005644886.1 hypothetical protein COCSUDRAFT_58050 [Coccomyxa subellipsoidea C-169]
MGLRVTCFHWSRDLSSSAQHGPGGASFTPGALASPPSAGGLAHHRTCLRGSPLGYPSARRIHRAPRYLWSTVPESQSGYPRGEPRKHVRWWARPPALGGEASAPGVKEAPPGPCWAELDRSLDQWKHVTRSPIPRWQRLEVGEAQSFW